MTGSRLRVDPIACDGRGLCAEVLPEMITLDDWGFPVLRDAEVPPVLLDEAAEAVRLCPRLALRLDHPPGTPGASRRRTADQGQDHRLCPAAVPRDGMRGGDRRR